VGADLCALALQHLDAVAKRGNLVSGTLELPMEDGNLVLGSDGRSRVS
jgi:hypothetical protein